MAKRRTGADVDPLPPSIVLPQLPEITGDDIALALEALGIDRQHWRKQGRSKRVRERVAAIDALAAKLNTIFDALYPYIYEDIPAGYGSMPIYGPTRVGRKLCRDGARYVRSLRKAGA